jgi:hypothetical protein
VVIELKRSKDGGHMELQALRYAAMVSTMTFSKAVDVFQRYLVSVGDHGDARERMLKFLEWDDDNSGTFAQDVRIVPAAADFSRELTNCVLWLNERDLDITCVRMRPYKDDGRLLIDVDQEIPLRSAEQYQVQIREKKLVERAARTQGRDFTRYDVTVGTEVFRNLPKRWTVFRVVKALCAGGVDPDEIAKILATWKSYGIRAIDGTLRSSEFKTRLADLLASEGAKPDTGRYFVGEDELIHANGKTYALTNQWGPSTTIAIDTMLEQFPTHHISYSEAQSPA